MTASDDFKRRALPKHLWIPVDRNEAPLMELAIERAGRVTRNGFPALLADRVRELAGRCVADTGTPAGHLVQQTFARAGASVPEDAPPEEVAARLMGLPAMAQLLERIDWSRSPAHTGANANRPANAPQAYRALTLADLLALLR